MKAQVTPANDKAFSVLWGPIDETVVTGHEDGAIIKWDLRTAKKVTFVGKAKVLKFILSCLLKIYIFCKVR